MRTIPSDKILYHTADLHTKHPENLCERMACHHHLRIPPDLSPISKERKLKAILSKTILAKFKKFIILENIPPKKHKKRSKIPP